MSNKNIPVSLWCLTVNNSIIPIPCSTVKGIEKVVFNTSVNCIQILHIER
ncbi:unnamed protein product [Schistosoma curassoni]|uniref:Uncharacterized protein n=1 Tax=Schistosoma curassoni TaxID=6186 RepID=A0A183KQ30_9TREM|nr:unnamed protein product [Schistosoma curassoni]